MDQWAGKQSSGNHSSWTEKRILKLKIVEEILRATSSILMFTLFGPQMEEERERERDREHIWRWLPGGSDGKESACNAGDLGSIPGLGRSPGGGHGNPLQVFLPGESPWTEEPGGLKSMGSQRVRHNWVTKLSTQLKTSLTWEIKETFRSIKHREFQTRWTQRTPHQDTL